MKPAVAVLALALAFPAAASAAATRPVQAVDGVGTHVWVPGSLPAQQGDTIEWRVAQPGNSAQVSHDVWLVAPGAPESAAVQLSTASPTTGASAVVNQIGTYSFFCSIHGRLTAGGMNGTITVGADDPGPPTDPGQAWLTPPPSSGPPPAVNTFDLPPVFESGDTTPPAVTVMSVSGVRRGARLRVRVSEAATLTVRLERGSKLLATRRVRVHAGAKTVTVQTRSRVKTSRVRLRITAKDAAQLESAPRYARVWIGD
jgi:plastocyanin